MINWLLIRLICGTTGQTFKHIFAVKVGVSTYPWIDLHASIYCTYVVQRTLVSARGLQSLEIRIAARTLLTR